MYLVLSKNSLEYAKAISSALWKLSRPDAGELDTKYYNGWIEHKDTRVALEFPDGDTQPVHVDADSAAFVAVIAPVVSEAEQNAIQGILDASRGSRINILQVLQNSPSLTPNLKTREQMEADGWFSEENI
jgi:hypothetical protein